MRLEGGSSMTEVAVADAVDDKDADADADKEDHE